MMRLSVNNTIRLLLIAGTIFLSSCETISLYFASKKTTNNETPVTIFVPTGSSLSDVYTILENNGILSHPDDYQAIANYKELTNEKIAAGKYTIAPKLLIKDLLNSITINSLGNGNKEQEVLVTFNNCRHIYDLAGKVATQLELDSAKLIAHLTNKTFLTELNLTEATVGIIFMPDTYRFFWDTDEVKFTNKMLANYHQFWNEERKASLQSIGLSSPAQAVTLASIVYKEQDKHQDEWPIIAGLYLNRIRNGWLLQSDPTFRFCWGEKLSTVQRLTYEHRSIDCPYNTYLYAGLPPGPIYLPPAKAIHAVLNPTSTGYFYMCAKPDGDGLHNFAKTLTEHNKNARAYQTWLSQNNIR